MSYVQTSANVESDDDEIVEISANMVRKKGSRRLFGVLIAVCSVVLAVTVIIICYQLFFNSNNTAKSEDLANAILEDPTQCLMDENCTSFTFDNSEISRIKKIFNEYDGDNDDLWAKEEFIRFYIESMDGGGEYDSFDFMDLNHDNVWSYKEAVIYFMIISELSSVRNIIHPLFEGVIQEMYNYNTTVYKDQLFWEYVAELTFVELDDFQQGFVTKENYLKRVAGIEFDVFAKTDPNHDTITFDEFLDSRFSPQAMDIFVNTDLDALSAEYTHLGVLFNNSNIDELLSGLQLKHCLYSGIDFENIRRRLATSKWDCIWAIVGCSGGAVATVAVCIASAPTVVGIVACAGGLASAASECADAVTVCQAYLDGK